MYIDKMTYYELPSSVTELRRFLGIVNFGRRFVKNCSVISKPLTEWTGGAKKQELRWTDVITDAFKTLKTDLKNNVRLSYPDYAPDAAPLEVAVDASALGAGDCISLIQNGLERVISYASTTFIAVETRYSTIERELAAIRYGIKIFLPLF